MVKLSSKLRNNENNTDLSLYQIYLLKVQENNFEYYQLDSHWSSG